MKKNKNILLKVFVPILCIILVVGACKKSNNETEETESSGKVSFKGWGNSIEDPEGTPLVLPKGVEFVQAKVAMPLSIGQSEQEKDECTFREQGEERVSGIGEGKVSLCVSFRNKTSNPVQVVLPPGLIFIATKTTKQNGFLSEKVTFEVPANQIYFHQLNLHCINGSRDPATTALDFKLGPVSNVKPVQELITFLESKDIHKDMAQSAFIGVGLHNIGDKGKISDFVWGELKKIPNK